MSRRSESNTDQQSRASSERRGAVRSLCFLALVALLVTGCGSRVDHATLEASFLGNGTADPSAVSADGGAPVDGAAPGAVPGAPASKGAKGGAGTGTGTGAATGTGTGTGTTGTKSNDGVTGKTATAGRKCTGKEKPIAIASVGEQTGVAGATEAPGPLTVSAWAAWINQNGGLACHQVKHYIGDAKGDPSKNASLTQQYVEQNGVVAFVQNNGALSANGSTNYLVSKNIPVIGGDGGSQAFYEYANFFPQVGQGDVAIRTSLFALAKSLNADQRSHFGFVTCQEAAQCTNVAKIGPGYAKEAGLKVIFSASASILQPDYTSVCLNAQKAGVKALILALDGSSMARFAKSCKSVNYNPTYGTGEPAVTPGMADDPNLDGMVVSSLAKPWTDNSNPSIKQMNGVIGQYAPGLTNVGQAHLGWTSAKLLEAASVYFPAKDTITSADILAAMRKIKNNDLGGLTGPLNFTGGGKAPQKACYFTMVIKGGKFSGTNGNRRFC